jgi:hypothetical protein
MPRGDGTGPVGMGPMAGCAAGTCAGFGIPGYANPGRGFGMGFGRGCGFGGGRGWRHRFLATGVPGWIRSGGADSYQKPAPEVAKQALKYQANVLQSELDLVKERLSEMEKDPASQ